MRAAADNLRADIIAIDICHDVAGALPMATPDDLAETVKLVEAQGRRIIAAQADVRDFDAVKAVVDEGVAELGRLDIVVANAGIASIGGPVQPMAPGNWKDTIDINLTGLWNTARAAVPPLIAGGRGGSIVLTSSVGGMHALPNMSHYVSAKHGVVGLMRSLAVELGQHRIRVNSVHPTNVNTPMFMNEGTSSPPTRAATSPASPSPSTAVPCSSNGSEAASRPACLRLLLP